MKYDSVLSNPPYSLKWDPDKLKNDERFNKYDLAPKSKADYAFVLDGIYNLDDKGMMAVILPNGVLFRQNNELKIRRELIENNLLDAVIGLPEKLFDVTSIPVIILVFKKNRKNDDVIFIDASNEFEKGKNHNYLTDEQVKKIYNTFIKRKDVDKYAHDATVDEIKENDFNLNVPRYVDTFEPEQPVDVEKLVNEMKTTDAEIDEVEKKLVSIVDDLVGTNEKGKHDLKIMKGYLHEKEAT